MKSAYFRRLFLPYLLLICGAMLIVGLLSARRLRATYLDRTAHGMRDNSALVVQLIQPNLRADRYPQLVEQIESLGATLRGRITVMSADGTVIADNTADPQQMENHRFRPEVIDTLSRGEGVSVRRSDTIHEDMLYFAQRVPAADAVYVLRLAVHLRELDRQLATLYRNLALTAIIASAPTPLN